jgi:hypothetical protein
MTLSIRSRFQKKHVAFFTVVPLLLVTAMVNVDCPIDGGDGLVTSGWNMEQVRIVDIYSEEKSTVIPTCDFFLMYEYDVTLTLSNDAIDEAVGWIKLVLVDFKEGKPLAEQYTVVEVPGQTTLDISYNLWFSTQLDSPLRTEVKAEVITGEIECAISDGTGKIPLNSWPVVNNLESKMEELARVERPFAPPMQWYDDENA